MIEAGNLPGWLSHTPRISSHRYLTPMTQTLPPTAHEPEIQTEFEAPYDADIMDVVIGLGAFGGRVLEVLAQETTTRYPHGAPCRLAADLDQSVIHFSGHSRYGGLWFVVLDSITLPQAVHLAAIIEQADRNDALCILLLACEAKEKQAVLSDLVTLMSGLDCEPAAIVPLDDKTTQTLTTDPLARWHDPIRQAVSIINGLCSIYINGSFICLDLGDLRTVLGRTGGYFHSYCFEYSQSLPDLTAVHDSEAMLFWMIENKIEVRTLKALLTALRQQCRSTSTFFFGVHEYPRPQFHTPEVSGLVFCKLPGN